MFKTLVIAIIMAVSLPSCGQGSGRRVPPTKTTKNEKTNTINVSMAIVKVAAMFKLNEAELFDQIYQYWVNNFSKELADVVAIDVPMSFIVYYRGVYPMLKHLKSFKVHSTNNGGKEFIEVNPILLEQQIRYCLRDYNKWSNEAKNDTIQKNQQ
jgi:hypothetical protein